MVTSLADGLSKTLMSTLRIVIKSRKDRGNFCSGGPSRATRCHKCYTWGALFQRRCLSKDSKWPQQQLLSSGQIGQPRYVFVCDRTNCKTTTRTFQRKYNACCQKKSMTIDVSKHKSKELKTTKVTSDEPLNHNESDQQLCSTYQISSVKENNQAQAKWPQSSFWSGAK